MGNKILNTESRQKAKLARDRATQRLNDRGWKHDGLWWISPYTKLRYDRREALSVEEIRSWGESESAFLNDKDHSMWVKKEIDDNKLISMEELADKSRKSAELKKLAKDGCYR